MSDQKFPPGWDSDRVKALIEHYDHLDEDAQVAEDVAGQQVAEQTIISVPTALLPAIRQLLATHKSA